MRLSPIALFFLCALFDINALWWTFTLTDLAGHTANRIHRLTIIMQKHGKVPAVIGDGSGLAELLAFLSRIFANTFWEFAIGLPRIVIRCKPTLVKIRTHKIFQRHRHPTKNPATENIHRSTSPRTMSILPRITTVSATFCPRHISRSTVRLTNDGGRTR